jgi:8-oxo-dGTP pyrophosphatase MutT (NUDIX family)
MRLPVPEFLGALAAEIAAGHRTPAAPRDAATVVLLRPAEGGFEVLMLGRTRTMDFAPGAYVFPGGTVDTEDPGIEAAAVRETLEECGVRLPADALVPWARWITPEASNRRYDTWFYVAAMPDGEVVRVGDAESDSAEWLSPGDALEAARSGRITLLPPTAVMLAQLGGFASVDAVLAEHREIRPLMPVVVAEDGQAWLEMPEGAEYPL